MVPASRAIAIAGLLATALAAPPASADNAEWIGFTCGFASTNDPTGVVNQDPNAQTGLMYNGPIMLAIDLLDDDGAPLPISPHFPLESLTNITQHCTIQVNNSTPMHRHGPPEVPPQNPAAHCDFNSVITGLLPGPSVMLQSGCIVVYPAGPNDNVYICTWWEFDHDSMHEDWYWDAATQTAVNNAPADPFNPPPGTTCELAISAGA